MFSLGFNLIQTVFEMDIGKKRGSLRNSLTHHFKRRRRIALKWKTVWLFAFVCPQCVYLVERLVYNRLKHDAGRKVTGLRDTNGTASPQKSAIMR